MAKSAEELRVQLSAIEPDDSTYSGITAADIPELQAILADGEPFLAARAVFALGSVVNEAPELVSNALAPVVSDVRPQVRVALAVIARQLPADRSAPIIVQLLSDSEVGVRKFAVASTPVVLTPELRQRLQTLAANETVASVRAAAQDAAGH